MAELLGAVCSKVEGIPIVVIRKLIGDKCSILTDAVLLAVLFYNASLCISANAFCVKVIIGISDFNCGLVSKQITVFSQIQVLNPDTSLWSIIQKCVVLSTHQIAGCLAIFIHKMVKRHLLLFCCIFCLIIGTCHVSLFVGIKGYSTVFIQVFRKESLLRSPVAFLIKGSVCAAGSSGIICHHMSVAVYIAPLVCFHLNPLAFLHGSIFTEVVGFIFDFNKFFLDNSSVFVHIVNNFALIQNRLARYQ